MPVLVSGRPSSDGGIRKKKMRKGTHSCFECRRRKIRCIYTPENQLECTECFARGSKCIDQENANGNVVDQRKNLRERVSRLESVIEAFLNDKNHTQAADVLANLGTGIPTPQATSDDASPSAGQTAAALLGQLDDAGSRQESCQSPYAHESCHLQDIISSSDPVPTYSRSGLDASNLQVSNSTLDDEDDGDSIPRRQGNNKEAHTRRRLMAALPPLDAIKSLLAMHEPWWVGWRNRSLSATSYERQTLVEFAAAVLRKGNPSELGMLLLCVGIAQQVDDLKRNLDMVQSLIVSDDDYAATVEGMLCTILQTDCYTEIGQPRRAWLATRRCMTFAQLMGLHRNHSSSPLLNNIWWHLYQGDRFLSLLLGLPYGIADNHCDLQFPVPSANSCLDEQSGHFMVKVSMLAGQVIDRTQGVGDLSFASALEIDQKLDSLAEEVCTGFWKPNEPPLNDNTKMAQMRDCLLAQICFHQLRVYLHLPFMLKSANDPKLAYSRAACFGSSRDLLRVYQRLRDVNGIPLYECKVIDFLGFTAAVIIMLGLLGYGRLSPPSPNPSSALSHFSAAAAAAAAALVAAPPSAPEDEGDWALIESTMIIFQRAAHEKGGKVATQCARVLGQLRSLRHREPVGPDTPDGSAQDYRIVIPYFGTISVRRGARVGNNKDINNNSTDTAATNTRIAEGTAYTGTSSNTTSPSASNAAPQHQRHQEQTIIWPPSQPPQQNPTPTPTYSYPPPPGSCSDDPNIPHDGLYVQQGTFEGPCGLGLGFDAGAAGGVPLMPWQMGVGMDIDQDWGWYLQ